MRTAILAICAALGCSASSTNSVSPALTGTWGGPNVSVTASAQGATTEFVCAHGTIDQTIVPDANGNFSATGTYVYEHPSTSNGQPGTDSHSARYDGQITGTNMRISVTIPDKSQVFGPFDATLGTTGPSSKCL